MKHEYRLFLKRLTGKLWFRPLIFCLLSIGAALISHLADTIFPNDFFPEIKKSSLENLLTTISASMLVISIFAVGSMISAFSSASATATPRSFELIVADDVSQNALSVYIGSFIFSIVATVALKNEYYGDAGYFTLFILTIFVFTLVILTFLRWVDRISKLGRLAHTIKKIEEVSLKALLNRRKEPFMGGCKLTNHNDNTFPIYTKRIGYVQYINLEKLQKLATTNNVVIILNCIPGTFASLDKPLFYCYSSNHNYLKSDVEKLIEEFEIDDNRSFNDDPRFGLIALSEIASRALSPGINDPGTAIAILGSYVRLFSLWFNTKETDIIKYDRIEVPGISIADMFEDAFRPISRDGAGNIEVMLKLQKVLISISRVGDSTTKEVALKHSKSAYERAELVMQYSKDLEYLKSKCLFVQSNSVF